MREMRNWAEENRETILVSLAVVLTAFGVMLTCNTLAIDEEKSIIAGVNITVRRSRQSGVARATCPD